MVYNKYMTNTTPAPVVCSHCSAVEPSPWAFHRIMDGKKRYMLCTPCSDAQRSAYDEARKAELAARPKCEACDRRAGTWTVAGALLCGRCKTAAERAAYRSAAAAVPGALRGAAAIACPQVLTAAAVVELARSGR